MKNRAPGPLPKLAARWRRSQLATTTGIHAILALATVAFLSGCAARYVDSLSLPLIDRLETVARFEGKEVRLVGEVSNSRTPEILGVDVDCEDADLRGKPAEAYGILRRYVVTEEQARELDRQMIAHRGAGTFWRLEDRRTRALSKVGPPPFACVFTVPSAADRKPGAPAGPMAPGGRGPP